MPFISRMWASASLPKRACRLLPLAVEADVREVAAAEVEEREEVPVVLEVFPQPLPGPVILGGELLERRRAELGVEREETRNLERVEIADQTQAASPRVAVAVSRDQVTPQTHLGLERR